MQKQQIEIAADTNVVWELYLGTDPNLAREDDDLPEDLARLQGLITGKNNMYVLVVPAYGVALTMPRILWDQVVVAKGYDIPSKEAARFLCDEAQAALFDDLTDCVNPVSAVITGDCIATGATTITNGIAIWGYPDDVDTEAVATLQQKVDALAAAAAAAAG